MERTKNCKQCGILLAITTEQCPICGYGNRWIEEENISNDMSIYNAYGNLLKQCIINTFNPKTDKQRMDNITFAYCHRNELLRHFCDAYDYDYNTLKKAIIRENTRDGKKIKKGELKFSDELRIRQEEKKLNKRIN